MKKRSTKIISLVMALVMVITMFSFSVGAGYSGMNYNPADTQNETDKTIRFNSDGKLKIMHVTDTHLEHNENLEPSIWLIEKACDAEKPDIVMLTGDIAKNCENPEDTKKLINAVMNVFDSRNIPVAVTFGNHDSEGDAMTRDEVLAYYNTFSCSLSVNDVEALSGSGTFNIPVLASDSDKVKFNLWVFDSGDYDEEHRYSCVQADQVEWYKEKSDELAQANGGERVNSLVFQHIIVGEIYDALKKVKTWRAFAFPHLYNEGEYYMFNPDTVNHGIMNEKPCPGYYNFGQFDAMVEKSDVLAMFTGHDHTNAFSVEHKGIDIVNSLSTRYKGSAYTTQYGYRIIEVDENDTSSYETRVVRIYDMFDLDVVKEEKKNGEEFTYKTALEFAIKGKAQKIAADVFFVIIQAITGRKVVYPN